MCPPRSGPRTAARCAGGEGRGAPRARVQAKHFAPPVYLRSEAGTGRWGWGGVGSELFCLPTGSGS